VKLVKLPGDVFIVLRLPLAVLPASFLVSLLHTPFAFAIIIPHCLT